MLVTETLLNSILTKEVKRLRIKLWVHRQLYYVHSTTIIDDFEYDSIERKLVELEQRVDMYRDGTFSPTNTVGAYVPKELAGLIYNMTNYYLALLNHPDAKNGEEIRKSCEELRVHYLFSKGDV